MRRRRRRSEEEDDKEEEKRKWEEEEEEEEDEEEEETTTNAHEKLNLLFCHQKVHVNEINLCTALPDNRPLVPAREGGREEENSEQSHWTCELYCPPGCRSGHSGMCTHTHTHTFIRVHLQSHTP